MGEATLRFGLVGVGGIGHHHITGLVLAPNAKLAALCDPRGKQTVLAEREAAGFYEAVSIPDVPFYLDFYEMLRRESLDAVILATPDVTHCAQTVAALQAGCHVLCEKPLALTGEEAARMLQAEKRSGKRLFVGQVCRFAPGFVKAKELLDAGAIGTLFCVESQYIHGCHANLPADDWRRDPPRPVTVCGGCHAIDLLRYYAGDPVTVMAMGNRLCRTDWEVEDCSEVVMRFPQDVIGRVLTAAGCVAEYSMRTVLYGTEGTLTADNVADTVTVYRKETGQIAYPVEINTHNTMAEIQTMCEAIQAAQSARHAGMEGAKTLVVCQAAVLSLREERPVTVDYSVLV